MNVLDLKRRLGELGDEIQEKCLVDKCISLASEYGVPNIVDGEVRRHEFEYEDLAIAFDTVEPHSLSVAYSTRVDFDFTVVEEGEEISESRIFIVGASGKEYHVDIYHRGDWIDLVERLSKEMDAEVDAGTLADVGNRYDIKE